MSFSPYNVSSPAGSTSNNTRSGGGIGNEGSEVNRFVRQVLQRNGIQLNGGNLARGMRLTPRTQSLTLDETAYGRPRSADAGSSSASSGGGGGGGGGGIRGAGIGLGLGLGVRGGGAGIIGASGYRTGAWRQPPPPSSSSSFDTTYEELKEPGAGAGSGGGIVGNVSGGGGGKGGGSSGSRNGSNNNNNYYYSSSYSSGSGSGGGGGGGGGSSMGGPSSINSASATTTTTAAAASSISSAAASSSVRGGGGGGGGGGGVGGLGPSVSLAASGGATLQGIAPATSSDRFQGASSAFFSRGRDMPLPEEEDDIMLIEGPDPIAQVPGMVVIHVLDAAKKVKRNFTCERELLSSEMRYFSKYLSDASAAEGIDISVHCDVNIFAWLINYIKLKHGAELPEGGETPKLTTKNVVSILISSDFLQMDELVALCIKFCHDHLNAILRTPTNMSCITNKLLTQLASLFKHHELADIKDRKDKLLSKLYWKKLEEMFDVGGAASALWSCAECGKILMPDVHERVQCTAGRIVVDKQGHVLFNHRPDPAWDVNDHLSQLRLGGMSPKDIYWRIWGLTKYFRCTVCKQLFSASEFGHCRYHPVNADFPGGGSGKAELPIGTFTCCGQSTLRFDPTGQSQLNGCAAREHVPDRDPAAVGGRFQNNVSAGANVATEIAEIRQHMAAVTTSFERPPDASGSGGAAAFATNVFALEAESVPRAGTDPAEWRKEQATRAKQAMAARRAAAMGAAGDNMGAESEDEAAPEPVAPRVVVKKSRTNRNRRAFVIKPAAIRAQNRECIFNEGIGASDTLPKAARPGHWHTDRSNRRNVDMQRMDEMVRMAIMIKALTEARRKFDGGAGGTGGNGGEVGVNGGAVGTPKRTDAFGRIEARYAQMQHAAKVKAQREKAAAAQQDRMRKSSRSRPFF
eukprot:UC1_evm1s1803